jgi:hypothetical protein
LHVNVAKKSMRYGQLTPTIFFAALALERATPPLRPAPFSISLSCPIHRYLENGREGEGEGTEEEEQQKEREDQDLEASVMAVVCLGNFNVIEWN